MDQRKRFLIGFYFNYGSNWLGGVYYIKNIVDSLALLPEPVQPEIVLIYTEESKNYLDLFHYPNLKFLKILNENKYLGYLQSWIKGYNIYTKSLLSAYPFDALFPINDQPVSNKYTSTRIIAWYPDLQHKFYPEYFTKINLLIREWRIRLILKNSDALVVSSCDAMNHFRHYYKIANNVKIFTIPFVSNILDDHTLDLTDILMKYQIPERYFIVSNQFYEHKNHACVFKAIEILNSWGISVFVVFTGKVKDYRNKGFIPKLMQEVSELKIHANIKILGVIPRNEQIKLLKHSLAAIQPSFFEGWSTLVEDAKTLNVPIIVSDIGVHREQLQDRAVFFDPDSAEDLAAAMRDFIGNKREPDQFNYDLKTRMLEFAENFMKVFQSEKRQYQ